MTVKDHVKVSKSGPTQRKSSPFQSMVQQMIGLLGSFVGLILVVVLFSIPSEIRSTFLSTSNFQTVIGQTVIVALGALGMTLIIISGGIDLSVGSLIALTGVFAAALLSVHINPVLALLGAIALGGIVGAINGTLITSLKVTPFIVTLGTLGIARGVAKWVADEKSILAPPSFINNLTVASPQAILGFTPAVWITLVLAVVMALILKNTVFGRSVFAIGSNETASRLSGLRVDALKIAIYMISGLFIGLSGIIQFSRLDGLGDPTIATGLELDIIAAVVIGGGSLNGGEGSILGSLIGALIMSLLKNGSQLMGWPSYVQEIIIGVVIVVAVTLDKLRQRKRSLAA